jgi:SAM-dependent methyltransferase
VLRRLARWSDTSDAGRRARRALLANPLTARAIGALDRRRLRRLRRAGDLRERSKRRWRDAPPDPGLTWGGAVSGDAAVEVAEAHGAFGPGSSVVEIGPGYGRVLASCLARGVEFERYLGLELSERNVRHLRETFTDPRVEIRQGDAETASLGAPVDAVISFLTFKHLYPSFEAALANLAPQLREGGLVLFDLLEGSRAYFHRDRATFIRHYTRGEVTEILARTGLQLEGFYRVEHAPGRARLLVVARRAPQGDGSGQTRTEGAATEADQGSS